MTDDEETQVEELAEQAVTSALHGRGDQRERRDFTITKFSRHEDGYWHARVTPSGGKPIYVHRKHGSWMAPGSVNGKAVLKEVRPHVAAELQRKAVALERAAKRAEGSPDVAVGGGDTDVSDLRT